MSNMDKLRELSEKLEETEEELSTFFNLVPVLLCIVDQKTACFKRMNPAWERLLGYTSEEFCSRPWLYYIHPEDQATTVDITRFAKDQHVLNTDKFINRYRTKSGEYKTIRWMTSKFFNGKAYCVAECIEEKK